MGEISNDFSWSHSRYNIFRTCRHRYYYHYYAYWEGWKAGIDPYRRRLYILRKLASAPMWIGRCVHESVHEVIKNTRSRNPMKPEFYADGLAKKMEHQWKNSLKRLYILNPKKYPGLLEHLYGEEMTDSAFQGFKEYALGCLLAVYQTEIYQRIRDGKAWIVESEERKTFRWRGNQFWSNIDLLCRSVDGSMNPTWEIVDWKTGHHAGQPDTIAQLKTYVLSVASIRRVPAHKICTREVNLFTGDEISRTFSEEELRAWADFIDKNAGEMRSTLQHPVKNIACEKDFPARLSEFGCIPCPFLLVCRPVLDSEDPRYQARIKRRLVF